MISFYLLEKLPANFSQTLQMEEEKKRPKFDTNLQVDIAPVASSQSNSGINQEIAVVPKEVKSTKVCSYFDNLVLHCLQRLTSLKTLCQK